MVANLIPDSQSPTDIVDPITAQVTRVNLDDVAVFSQLPTRDEWRSRYYDDNTKLNAIRLAIAHKHLTCAICGGGIERGHQALFGTDGDAVHMREYVCERNLANSPKVKTSPTTPTLTVTNGTVHSEIEDALANQRNLAAIKRMQSTIHEAVETRAKLTPPDFPVNWEQHKAKFYTPTTPEFMAVLDEIEASQEHKEIELSRRWHLFIYENVDLRINPQTEFIPAWVYSGEYTLKQIITSSIHSNTYYITRYADVCDQPQPAPTTEPDDDPQPVTTKVIAIGRKAPKSTDIVWTVAKVKTWLERRQDYTRESFEAGKIDKKRATADDIRDVCSAIRFMGGKRYPYLIDDLKCIRILERNSDEKLVEMLKTLNRQLWALYAKHSLGDDNQSRRLG